MSIGGHTITIDIRVNMGTFAAGINQGITGLHQFAVQAQRVGSELTGLGVKIGAFGAALGSALVFASKSGMEFQKEMSAVNAITQGMPSDFKKLSDEAKRLGAETEWTATQAANGMRFLAMSGYDTNQILAAMPATLALATVGQINLGRASDIAANILIGFGLAAEQANRVIDVLALTATKSNADISDLGEAMKYIAPVAGVLGVSIEEASAAVGVLANAGIKASLAGTGFRRALSVLAMMSGVTQNKLLKAGVEIKNVDIKTQGLQKTLEALKGLSISEVMSIFGERSGPAMLVLLQNLNGSFKKLKDQVEGASGAALTMQQIMLNNVAGAFTELESRLESVRIAFFETFQKGLQDIVLRLLPWIDKLIAALNDPSNREFIMFLTGAAAAVSVIATVVGGLLITLGAVVGAVAGIVILVDAIAALGVTLAGAATFAAAASVAIVGFGAFFVALIPNMDKLGILFGQIYDIGVTMWRGFIAGADDFLPVFDMVVASVGFVISAFTSLIGTGTWLQQLAYVVGKVFGILAAVIGTACVIAVGLLVGSLTVLGYVLTAVFGVLGGILVGLLGKFDLVAVAAAHMAEEVNKAKIALDIARGESFEEIITAFDKISTSSREILESVGKTVSKEQELLALLEKKKTEIGLTSGEANRLISLVSERAKLEKAVTDTLNAQREAVTAQIKQVEAAIKIANSDNNLSSALPSLQAELGGLQTMLVKISDAQEVARKIGKELADTYGTTKEAILAKINALELEQAATDKVNELLEAHNANEKEYAKILQELRRSKMNDLEKEIDILNEKLSVEKEIVQVEVDLANAEIERLKLSLKNEKNPEVRKSIETKITDLTAVGAKNNAILVAQEKKKADDVQKLRDKEAANNKKIQDKITEDEMQAADDRLGLAKMNAAQKLEATKKDIGENFLTDPSMSADEAKKINDAKNASLLAAQKLYDTEVAKALVEEQERQAAAAKAATSKSVSNASSITSALAKQVSTLKELIELEKIRNRVHAEARSALFGVINAQASYEKAIAAGKDGVELSRKKGAVMLAEGRARNAFKDAGLNPDQVEDVTASSPAAITAATTLKSRLAVLKTELLQLQAEMKVIGGDIGTAFLEGLKPKIEEVLAYVKNAMIALKKEFDVDTKHSPSMRDVLNENVSLIGESLKNMGGVLSKGAPNMSAVAQAQAIPIARSVGVNRTDTNTLNMNVNNKYDLSELTRKVGIQFNRRRSSVV